MTQKAFPYKVLGEYIRGGCSVIYKIMATGEEDTQGGEKEYVLKTMLETEEDPQSNKRFYMEYEFLRAYPHPNLIEVKEYYEDWEGKPAYVMEWLEGNTWQNHWRDRNVFEILPEFLDLFKQLCDVLDFIHKHQIIHRDLKPQNILVSNNNELKLIDFGIMKVADLTLYTHRNTFMGSAYYVSPEGISGEQVTHTADIFALGVMLYDLFTGMKPFKGPTLGETIYQRLVKKPQAPSQICEDVPQDLDPIILRMMNRDPRLRYQSCAEIYREVELVLANYQPKPKAEDQINIDILTKGPFLHAHLMRKCRDLLKEEHVLFLQGAEGTGKTTFVENLGAQEFGESPLRLSCSAGASELEFMESILRRLPVTAHDRPEMQPWIEILGAALPGLQWKTNSKSQRLGNSTILTAFQRILFSLEERFLLIIEELHDAPPALTQFLGHLARLVKSSSNQSVSLVFTTQEPIRDMTALGPWFQLDFPDVVNMSEFLKSHFGDCGISVKLTEALAGLSGRNLARFIQNVKSSKANGRLAIEDGELRLTDSKADQPAARGDQLADVRVGDLHPTLEQFTQTQIQQLQWIALCPDGLDLNLLKSLTKSDLTSIGQTLDAADSANLVEFQSSTTGGFRWKETKVRDFLIEALSPAEKRQRFLTLARTIEEESRQFLSYSPPLWLMLARLFLQAGEEDKSAEYAFKYGQYCFQNANYDPIRNFLSQFTNVAKFANNLEFWSMLAFAYSGEDLARATQYAGKAVAIEENAQTLALSAILEYDAFNHRNCKTFLDKAFRQKDIAHLDIRYASRLIIISMAMGDEEKSKALFELLKRGLKNRQDLYAANTLTIAKAALMRPDPEKVIHASTALKDNEILPQTQWKLCKWTCIAYQEMFQYDKALACLNKENLGMTEFRHFRESLFLNLNFHKLGQVKNLIPKFQQVRGNSADLGDLEPLFQLATEVVIQDRKICEFNHVLSTLTLARVEKTLWLVLFANLLTFSQIQAGFAEELHDMVSLGGVPWARHQLPRYGIVCNALQGNHLELVVLFKKALEHTDKHNLIMERLRLKRLRDDLVEAKMIPQKFQIPIPQALSASEQTAQFLGLTGQKRPS